MQSKSSSLATLFSQVKAGDFGIIGDPLNHTLSPDMQNAALEYWASGKNMKGRAPRYHKIPVKPEELAEAAQLLRRFQLKGFNVTIPHKERISDFISDMDEFAKEVGSVNTIVLNEDRWKGYNTDGFGFETSVRMDLHFDPRGRNALILGSGGTGKVIAHQLLKCGAGHVFLWNRHPERTTELLKSLKPAARVDGVSSSEDLKRAVSASDLIINATAVGLREEDGEPVPGLRYSSAQVYFDVIYHRETLFLQKARRARANAIGGIGMLLYQGARAFEIWTKASAPLDVMKKALEKTLNEKGIKPIWPSDI